MINVKHVWEGWKNHLLPDERNKAFIEYISKERNDICIQCNEHSYNKPKYTTIRPDAHCTNCGCTLAAKTKCLTCECPLKKWGATEIPTENETK